MNEILDVVARIPGVSGTALCNQQGECVLSQLISPFEPVLIKKIVSEVRGVFQTMRYLDDAEPQFLVIHFDDVVVAVRQIEELTLVAFATSTTSVTMLGVAFNVVNLKIRDHGIANFDLAEGTGLLRGRGSQRPPRPSGGMPTPVPIGSASLSISDSAQPAAPDFIGDELVERLVKALARQLGPAARFVFKQQVKHIGLTVGAITPNNLSTVVDALLQRVTDVAKREAFLSDVRALLRR
ncbi:MAG TPA: hypothetical protein VHT91_40105 [Kofleriaceae bacterium]|jgi:hypothetical protein|nr:hypothetical protein [Kofleriaceae bacterium]